MPAGYPVPVGLSDIAVEKGCQLRLRQCAHEHQDDRDRDRGAVGRRGHQFGQQEGARGVPEEEAKLLLVLAFLAEALDEIDSEDIANDMRLRLRRWLERHTH